MTMKLRIILAVALLVATAWAQMNQPGTLYVWIDDTKSVPPKGREDGLSNLKHQLPSIISTFQFEKVAICHFGDDGWNASCVEFPVPQSNPVECEMAKVPGELKKFRTINEALEQRAEKACRDQKNKSAKEYQGQGARFLESVGKAMATLSEAKAPCTAVSDALARIATGGSEKDVTIMLSDGRQTCRAGLSRVPAPAVYRPVVVLVTERNAAAFADSKMRLRQMAPWLTAVEPAFTKDLPGLFSAVRLAKITAASGGRSKGGAQ